MRPHKHSLPLRYSIREGSLVEETLRYRTTDQLAHYIQTKNMPFKYVSKECTKLFADEHNYAGASLTRLRQMLVIVLMPGPEAAKISTRGGASWGINMTVVLDMCSNASRTVLSPELPPRRYQSVTMVGDALVLHGGEHRSYHRAVPTSSYYQSTMLSVIKYSDSYVFDAEECTWRRLDTQNPPPPSSRHNARELDRNRLFVYGGDLPCPYVLDLTTLQWTRQAKTCQERLDEQLTSVKSTDYLQR